MKTTQQPDPLLEWNRLNRENIENAIVSSMFEASSEAIHPIESFVTWLLVGAATVASFLLSNSDKLVPVLGERGFLGCGILLAASFIFGLLAKACLMHAEIGRRVGHAIATTLEAKLTQHEEDENQIQEGARKRGIELETHIRMERIISEFLAPQPALLKWLVSRHLNKHSGNPQVGYVLRIQAINRSSCFWLLQSLTFLSFIVVGFAAAAT